MKLILASTSLTRRVLLESLGLAFEVEAPGVEEDVPPGTTPEAAALLLAERKARAVFERHPEALVIGSDQIAALRGRPLGKPADRQAAREQLSSMRGQAHHLCTGLCVLGPGLVFRELDVATLLVHPFSDEELEHYLDLEEWRGCAGSYRIEGAGQALFSDIQGDRTSIMGLPMLRVTRALRQAGVRFFERPLPR